MTSTPISTQLNRNDCDELIRLHLPLAYRLAACYRGSGQDYEDLVEIAEVGLVKAAEHFDPSSGVGFRAFAAPMISGELSRSVREHKAAQRTASQPDEQPGGQVAEFRHRISTALGHGPRVRELARQLDVDADVVADALLIAAGRETVTLNLPAQRCSVRGLDRLHVTPAAA